MKENFILMLTTLNEKEKIQEMALNQNQSLSQFCLNAVMEKIEKENANRILKEV